MKKSVLVLLTFVPVVIGYFLNISIALPVIGAVLFYILPLLTTVFWFYLGRQYARSSWNTIPALLIGNAAGFISLLLYLWQFLLETDETRNLTLAVASQMFSAAVPTYLFVRLAALFETQANYIGRATMVALQVISFAFMVIVFLCGYSWEKKKLQNTAIE